MKRLLITGFDPFGGATVNPSWMAVERLPEHIGDCVFCSGNRSTAIQDGRRAVTGAYRRMRVM